MAFWHKEPNATGYWFRAQSDYVTAAADGTAADWTKLTCEMTSPALADGTVDLADAVGQVGASGDQLAGSEDGISFSLKGAFRGMVDGWDPTAAIDPAPEWTLFADFLGGASSRNYQAASVGVASDADTVVLASGVYLDGQFVAFGASASTLDVRGFVKDAVELTLRQDAESVAVSGDHGYGARTLYPTATQPTARTFRVLGGSAWQDIRLVGCVPIKLSLKWGVKEAVQWAMDYVCTALRHGDDGDDLIAAPGYQQVPAFLGRNFGRVQLAHTPDGAVSAADAYCPVAEIEVTITREPTALDCPSALEGVVNRVLGAPEIMIALTVPIQDTDISAEKTVWDNRYTARTSFDFAAYVGHDAGRVLAMMCPSARLSKRPTLAEIAGKVVGHRLEFKPAPYTGDASSTAPGNTTFQLAVA